MAQEDYYLPTRGASSSNSLNYTSVSNTTNSFNAAGLKRWKSIQFGMKSLGAIV